MVNKRTEQEAHTTCLASQQFLHNRFHSADITAERGGIEVPIPSSWGTSYRNRDIQMHFADRGSVVDRHGSRRPPRHMYRPSNHRPPAPPVNTLTSRWTDLCGAGTYGRQVFRLGLWRADGHETIGRLDNNSNYHARPPGLRVCLLIMRFASIPYLYCA